MPDIFVGSVAVGVVPDARGWNDKLRAQLVPSAGTIGDEYGRTMGRKIADQMGKSGSDSAGAFDATFRKRLKAALDALPKAKIDGDSTAVDRKVAELRAKLEELSRMDVIDAKHAMEQLAIVDKELGSISDKAKDIRVSFNTTEARAQLALLKRDISGTSPTKGILSGLSASPGIIGPAVALAPAAGVLGGVAAGAAAGIGGAFVTAALSLAGFAAVAKPVLSQAETATQAVETAQLNYNIAIATGTKHAVAYKAEQVAINKAYAQMSPAQIALSKQLGVMGKAWDAVKAAQTPFVAAAITPWIKAVTDGMKLLGPIVQAVAPVIGYLGTQFDKLINSGSFRTFRDFIAGTGSAVVSAAGTFLLDFVKAMVILLPDFEPLIRDAAVHLAALGQSLVNWASNKKTADDINTFIKWFSTNGPSVWNTIKNIGDSIKAIAPGLTAGGTTELSLISTFLGLVAGLPPGIAKPLFEIGGALLILNKLGVVNVGIKLLGMDAAAAAASGGAVGLWGKMLPGVRMVSGVLTATLVVDAVLSSIPNKGDTGVKGQKGNWFETPFNMPGPKSPKSSGNWLTSWAPWERFLTVTVPGWFTSMGHGAVIAWNIMWDETIARGARGIHDIASIFDTIRHNTSNTFDNIRHGIAHVWDVIYADTIGKLINLYNGVIHWFDTMRHDVAHIFDVVRHDIAHYWDVIWSDTIGKIQLGISNAVAWFKGMPGRITTAVGNLLTLLVSKGGDIISGLLSGITTAMSGIGKWIETNVVDPIVNAVKNFFGIKSPSTVMMGLGSALIQGLIKGMLTSGKDLSHLVGTIFGGWAPALGHLVSKSLVDIAKLPQKALSALGKVGGAIGGFFNRLFGGGGGGGAGVDRWTGTIIQALGMLGLPISLVPLVKRQMQSESGGDPNAINLTDINAQRGDPSRGLMQTIGSTFALWHVPGTSFNIYDPLANIAAALNYAEHGRGFGSGTAQLGSGHAYDAGGWLPAGVTIAYNGTGAPERVLSHAELRSGGIGGNTVNYNAHFDSLTGAAIESHVQTAFTAMSLTQGHLNRSGRRS